MGHRVDINRSSDGNRWPLAKPCSLSALRRPHRFAGLALAVALSGGCGASKESAVDGAALQPERAPAPDAAAPSSPNPEAPSPQGPPSQPSPADASGSNPNQLPDGQLPDGQLLDGQLLDDEDLSPGASGGVSQATSCAATSIAAETIERTVEVPVEVEVTVPSVFYLMLDRSGSMVSDPFTLTDLIDTVLALFGIGNGPTVPPTKWEYAVAGLTRFINDPASAGIELALHYFPEGGLCDGVGYDQPSVAMTALPEGASEIERSLAEQSPAGGTPLEGALRGATQYCKDFNTANPDRSCVAVLITDGAAGDCEARSGPALAAIAAAAAEQGVLTFAAGMEGADFDVLNAIGQAGGADCDPLDSGFACDLTADADAFVRSLSGIRDRTRTQTRIETRVEQETQPVPCAWRLPEPPPNERFDPSRVNVDVTSGTGTVQTLRAVTLASDCANGDGWYYDDPASPETIQACPTTCRAIEADPEVRVELLLGCQTVIR